MRADFSKLKILVSDEVFIILRSKKFYTDAFANVRNKDEITVIIEQSKFKDEDFIEKEEGWKLITFDTVLGLDLVGFVAEISSALAREGISIFVLSSYFTDHIFVRMSDLDNAIESLKRIGVRVDKGY